LSPSRSSMASREPVDAPDGTAARPMVPDSSSTSHSTVGLPRESRISRPTMSTMALIVLDSPKSKFELQKFITQKAQMTQKNSYIDFLFLRPLRVLCDFCVRLFGC